MLFNHITSTPDILNGKPCVRGTRISVELILETVASGASLQDIQKEFPQLSMEALQEAIRYALNTVRSERIVNIALAA